MRTPRAMDAKVEGPFTLTPSHIPLVRTAASDFGELLLPAYPSCGKAMLTLFFRYFRGPRTAGGVRGSLGEKQGGGVLHPARADFHARLGE